MPHLLFKGPEECGFHRAWPFFQSHLLQRCPVSTPGPSAARRAPGARVAGAGAFGTLLPPPSLPPSSRRHRRPPGPRSRAGPSRARAARGASASRPGARRRKRRASAASPARPPGPAAAALRGGRGGREGRGRRRPGRRRHLAGRPHQIWNLSSGPVA